MRSFNRQPASEDIELGQSGEPCLFTEGDEETKEYHDAQITPEELYNQLALDDESSHIRLFEPDGPPRFPFAGRTTHATTEGESITGKLRVVSLADSPNFKALSYVWGHSAEPTDETQRFSVSCSIDSMLGRCSLGVTKNCVDALRGIGRLYGAVTIWVDAICIDQNNIEEKATQIPLMEDIYRRATVVYAWIGKGTEGSDRSIKFLKRASLRKNCTNGLSAVYSPAASRASRLLALVELTIFRKFRTAISNEISVNEALLDDIHAFFASSWFSRGWTFQEAVLAFNPVIVCGKHAISWESTLRAVGYLLDDNAELRDPRSQRNIAHIVGLIHVWMAIERPPEWNGRQLLKAYSSSTSFMTYQRELRATADRYDYFSRSRLWVYGISSLVGLAGGDLGYRSEKSLQDSSARLFVALFVAAVAISFVFCFSELLDEGLAMWVVDSKNGDQNLNADQSTVFDGIVHAIRERHFRNPKDRSYGVYGVLKSLGVQLSPADYSKDLSSILHELFVDLAKWEARFLILILDAGEASLLGAPSWVPRWTQEGQIGWLGNHYYYQQYGKRKGRTHGNFHGTTKDSEPLFQLQNHGSELILFGHGIGKAHTVCKGIRSGDDPETQLQNIVAIQDWLKSVKRTGLEVFEELQSTTVPTGILDALEGGRRDEDDCLPLGFDEWFHIMDGAPSLLKEEPPTAQEDPDIQAPESSRRLAKNTDHADYKAEKLLNLLSQHSDVMEYHGRVCQKLAGIRSLFVTARGFIGTGPLSVLDTDEIYLFSGLPVPLVIRQCETPGKFVLIGPASIHAARNGQLWRGERVDLEKVILV